jgi:glycosyltransferase involved in cell wall biosynthesis
LRIALDATYSTGAQLTGVGVYSREILHGLADVSTQGKLELQWLWCYRSQSWLGSLREARPRCVRWRPLFEGWTPHCDLYHGLNQRLPRELGSPSVVTFHDLFVITGDYSSPEFRARFRDQAASAAARADAVITVSRFTADQVRECLNVEESRITVIPHGVRVPPGLRRDPRPWVLSVGVIQRRKNTIRLVEAFEMTPAAERLILAGPAGGYDAASILERIHRSPRRAAIEVTGWVDQQSLERLYAQAGVFVFPSLDEGFGMPVLDAMARGVPVVTSSRSALPEVAGEAALLVNPENVGQIAEAISKVIGSQALRQDMAERGLARSRRFSWPAAVSATLDVYGKVSRRARIP